MRFVKNDRPQQEEKAVSLNCVANGCFLRGTISTSSDRWLCAYHHIADPEKWPAMTETLREHGDVLEIIDDLLKISEVNWSSQINDQPAQRGLFMMLFDDRPHLKPGPDENRSKYEYRLRNHICEVAGVVGRTREKSYMATKRHSNFKNASSYF